MTKTRQEYVDSIDKPFDDRLSNIMFEQESFLRKFVSAEATEEERLAYSKEYILAAMREMSEVLNELPWKLHRPKTKEIDVEAVHEEIIDVLKFVINIGLLWGMGADELYKTFLYKSGVVRERLRNEQELLNNKHEDESR